MKKKILILAFILFFTMACALGRFARNALSSSIAPLPTYTESNPSVTQVAATTEAPQATTTPTITISPTNPQVSPTSAPSGSATHVKFASGIGVSFDCGTIIRIQVISSPVYYQYLNTRKANGTWLVVQLQLTNLLGETYNFLHENDFSVQGTKSDQTLLVVSTQAADIEAYFIWSYADYLADPLSGGGTSKRIVAFDVDPSVQQWTLIFTPKDSMYSTTPFCSLEIPLR